MGESSSLVFPWGAIKPLIEHTRQCDRWQPTLAERVQAIIEAGHASNDWEAFRVMSESPGVCANPPSEAGLLLVGDHGVYLMSSGIPDLMAPEDGGERRAVVYALGCDPERDPDWYDTKQDTFGGDDGVDKIPLSFFDSLEEQFSPTDQDGLVVTFTDGQMAFSIRQGIAVA
ncbi:DUF3085 domain-containing protein [Thioalkalivibrio sp. ALE16]|uniref:DUF3085 domain-containing protein n=1 Tax=Thioalkalivibrio sp. ALE16 TaxID=1158172 RepID=UPI00035F4B2B|nr:DUF3085 domain-containing protein [Thioalkalivibrio sp. ALE16]